MPPQPPTVEQRLTDLEKDQDRQDQILSYHQHLGWDETQKLAGGQHYVNLRVLGPSTVCSVRSSVGGVFEVPTAGGIVEIGAYVDTAGVTGVMTIDVKKNGASIMATKITIDSAETSSRTAATAPAIGTSAFNAGDLITVDITGVQTTAARGLSVRFTF